MSGLIEIKRRKGRHRKMSNEEKYGLELRHVDENLLENKQLNHREIVRWNGDYCYVVCHWKKRRLPEMVGDRWVHSDLIRLFLMIIRYWLF
jgi:hypothetical protein